MKHIFYGKFVQRWSAMGTVLALSVSCTQIQSLFLSPHKQSSQAKAPAYSGEIRLEIDPSLLGEKYSHRRKASLTSKGFTIKSTTTSGFDELDQVVVNKANQLVASGQSHCVHVVVNERQNANCNSNSSGFQCSGPVNKTIQAAQCPEIAIYGGAMNINHTLPASKLWVAVTNNLTINQGVKGILSTRGDLNTSISGDTELNGVFVGARSNNFNISGNAKVEGIYSILNGGTLAMNLNPNGRFEGQLCTTGQTHLNINSPFIYNPNKITPWQSELSFLGDLMCAQGNHPYTQIIPAGNPTPTPSASSTPIPTPTPTVTATPTPLPTDTTTPTPTASTSVSPTPSGVPSLVEVVFDPENPGSLADLFPDVPGNDPDTTIPETNTTLLAINNQPPGEFKTGQLAISLKAPVQQNLQTILQRYNAQLAEPEPVGGFYLIQVDLSTINLDNLLNNLHQINLAQTNPEFITQSASFANLESAKTFALLVELMVSGLVDGADMDNVLTTAEGIKTAENSEVSPNIYPNIVPKAENSWWLNDQSTRVTRAWNYSMGYNRLQQRPVKVAVIDSGFAGAYEATQVGKDLDGQILWDEGKKIIHAVKNVSGQWLFVNKKEDWTNENIEAESIERVIHNGVTTILTPNPHGTKVVSSIVSQANDGEGISGVAPHAKVIPYKLGDGATSSWWDLVYALSDINLNSGIDIVSFSLWSGDTISLYLKQWSRSNLSVLTSNGNEASVKSTVQALNLLIDDLTSKGIIVIACAGNGGWDISRNYPAGPNVPGIISVGAVEPIGFSSIPSESLNRAVFLRGGDNTFNGPPKTVNEGSTNSSYASNWGNVDIWAPGNNMLATASETVAETFNGDSQFVKLAKAGELQTWNGTSAATPVIAGIAALAKSINPSINSSNFRQLLNSTAHTRQYLDQYLRGFPIPQSSVSCGASPDTNCGPKLADAFITLKIANAESLLQNLSAPVAQLFRGTIDPNNQYRLNTGTETLELYWGGNNNSNLLRRLHYEDLTQNPSLHKPLSQLSSSDQVEVTGWRQANRVFFNQIRKTPVLTPKQWRLHVFNINDQAEVLINGSPVQLDSGNTTLVTNTGSGFTNVDRHALGIDITHLLSNATNQIEFRVYNQDQNLPPFNLPFAYAGTRSIGQSDSTDNGASWGFELYADNKIVYRDIRGNAASNRFDTSYISQPSLPRFGARRGSFGQGLVLSESIRVNKDGSIPVESGPYELLIYNVSDASEAIVNGQSFALTAQSPFETSYNITNLIQAQNNQFQFRVLGSAHTPTDTWARAIPSFLLNASSFPSQNLNQLNAHLDHQRRTYTWGFDLKRNGQLIYRNRDGERENLEVGSGNYRSFPAGARFNTRIQGVGESILNDQYQF